MKKIYTTILLLSTTFLIISCENKSKKYFESGNTKALKKDYRAAIEDYTKAIEIDTSFSEAYFFRGDANSKLSNIVTNDFDHSLFREKAVTDYSAAIKLNPKYYQAYFQRGTDKMISYGDSFDSKYNNTDYINSAISDFIKAIEINPKSDEAYQYMATAKLISKDYQGALEDYNKAVVINSNNSTSKDMVEKLTPLLAKLSNENNTNSVVENESSNQEQQSSRNYSSCKWCSSRFTGIGWSFESNSDGGYSLFEGKYSDLLVAEQSMSLYKSLYGGNDKLSNIGSYCSKKCAKEAAYNQ